MSEKILVTSALPYANGPLHFGHIAGAYLPGDCYARFQRLCGNDVLYICGSDEYGVAITLSAEMAQRSSKEHVDIFHKMNLDLFKKLDFSFDHYSRTTSKTHAPVVQEIFKDLYSNGFIEEKTQDHLYSEKEQRFLADRYVIGTCPKCGYDSARGDECQKCGANYEATDLINPKSKISGGTLTLKPSTHWYLRFDQFKERLQKWLEKKNWKQNVVAFTKHYIDELRPRAITRDSTWGVPIPLENTEGKVFYVWFDAPIGYISAVKEWAIKINDPNRWKDYWQNEDVKLVHFVGKDNIPFHTIFFPAMLMGQSQPYILPSEVPANEFLMLEGKPFSKSEGWYIDLEEFFKTYTTDQIRYYLAANAPETSDSDFSWKDFQNKCNGDLLGKLGNFIHRTLTFVQNKCSGIVPQINHLTQKDTDFLATLEKITDEAFHAYNSFKLRKAAQCLITLAQEGNVYFDNRKPWNLVKNSDYKTELHTVIACCIQCIKHIAIVCFPIIPKVAQKIWNMLGFTNLISEERWHLSIKSLVPTGQVLPHPKIIFTKIEDEQIEQEILKLGDLQQTPTYSALKETIDFNMFQKSDLRVAQILQASPVPKSNRLLQLTVDLGFEQRTVVSGIAQKYRPEELIGKKVILLSNIKPVKIMGIESQGMILTGSFENMLELCQFHELKPGSVIC